MGVARSLDTLLSDFGTDLPRQPAPEPTAAPEKLFPRVVGDRGVRRVGHGWAPTWPPLAGYSMTSEQAPVMWPLIAGDGLAIRPSGIIGSIVGAIVVTGVYKLVTGRTPGASTRR